MFVHELHSTWKQPCMAQMVEAKPETICWRSYGDIPRHCDRRGWTGGDRAILHADDSARHYDCRTGQMCSYRRLMRPQISAVVNNG